MRGRRPRRWPWAVVAASLSMAAIAGAASILVEAWSRSELVSPPPTLLVTDRHGRFLTEVGDSEEEAGPLEDALGFWAMDPPARKAKAATLAAEDRRFHEHGGVDLAAVGRAAVQNLRSRRRISGASTIAMQVARMQDPGPRTYGRKAMEALVAVLLVHRHGREAVLAHYLRVAPYGNRMRGYAFAARGYFDKPVEDLSWAEAALIAALPQSPSRMNPYDWEGMARAKERGRRILDALLEEGALCRREHAYAVGQIASLSVGPRRRRPEEAMHALLRIEEELGDLDLRYELARRPIVESTLDLDLQREVLSILGDAVASMYEQEARNGAAIVFDLDAGEIAAYVGSTDYFNSSTAGSIDYARVLRSPGSTLKPLLYALGLERGTITPWSILDDLPHSAELVSNADRRFLGPMVPRAALGNSRNVPAMSLQRLIGLDEAYAFMRLLELHDGRLPPEHYGAGLTLGAMPVTLEGLVRAYTALAGDGHMLSMSLTGKRGERPRKVVSEPTARKIGLYLSDPMARLPSFPRMGALEYPFPVAVKTGTASGYRDAWTVAYSRRYLVGVWVGHPDWRPMNRLTGARAAAPVARRILLHLEEDGASGLSDGAFPRPEGSERVTLCATTGLLASPACDRTLVEWVPRNGGPTERCRAHVQLRADSVLGGDEGAGRQEAVDVRTLVDLGPRYAAWAASSGVVTSAAMADPTARRNGSRNGRRDGLGLAFGMDEGSPAPSASVVSPVRGRALIRDPETPREHASLALEAVVEPAVPQVVWYVNGEPFEVVDHPYSSRWTLRPGEHRFEVRTLGGDAVSQPVTVMVR